MGENKTIKCPECNGEMEKGDYLSGYGAVRPIKHGDIRGDKVIPFYCKNCGFIKLYKKMKKKKE
jgi:predicted nucleic-acid-binding Zn-ribbon protein